MYLVQLSFWKMYNVSPISADYRWDLQVAINFIKNVIIITQYLTPTFFLYLSYTNLYLQISH